MPFATLSHIPIIVFNGIRLPRYAHLLDVATGFELVPEKTSVWFFNFVTCVGRLKHGKTNVVRSHAQALMDVLFNLPRNEVKGFILHRFLNQVDASIVIDEWLESLRCLIKMSSGIDKCYWVAGLNDAELAQMETMTKGAIRGLRQETRKRRK